MLRLVISGRPHSRRSTNRAGKGRRSVSDGREDSIGDPIDTPAPVDLLGVYVEAELLLQCPGYGAAHRVRLPLEFLDDLVDRGAVRTLEAKRNIWAGEHRPGCLSQSERMGTRRWLQIERTRIGKEHDLPLVR